jgi:peptidoglycan/LPS O-acetylase OafA/YrhL
VVIVNMLGEARRGDDAGERSAIARKPRLMERLIGAPPLRYTGKISYGIYLYHLPIYYLLWTYVPRRTPYFYAPIVLAASCALASVSWYLIEAPIVHRKRRAGPKAPRRTRPGRWRAGVGAAVAASPLARR